MPRDTYGTGKLVDAFFMPLEAKEKDIKKEKNENISSHKRLPLQIHSLLRDRSGRFFFWGLCGWRWRCSRRAGYDAPSAGRALLNIYLFAFVPLLHCAEAHAGIWQTSSPTSQGESAEMPANWSENSRAAPNWRPPCSMYMSRSSSPYSPISLPLYDMCVCVCLYLSFWIWCYAGRPYPVAHSLSHPQQYRQCPKGKGQ